jgi:hypothetical protein
MNRAQVAAIGAGALNLLYRTGRQIMMGVLVSSKTLAGGQNKYPHLYPPVKNLPSIFVSDPRFLNFVHYNTDNPLFLREELFKIIKFFQGGEKKNGLNWLNGFQLNIAWPAISQLEDVKTAFPAFKIVLQIGPQALEQADYSPEKVMAMASGYLPFVDYFLLDVSAGFGKPLDADNIRPYLRGLSDLFSAGLVIAGGLGPDTLHLAEPLIREFPEVSVDAQSGLQEKGALSINRSVEYIRRALKMYKQYE